MSTSSPLAALPPPVDPATDHILGPHAAPLTLIEYGDYECPACGQAYPVVESLLAQHTGRIRFVFRHFPLREVHPNAQRAAEASEAAAAQDQFWAYHKALFTHQNHLDAKHLAAHAEALSLDMARYTNELHDEVYRQRVQEHMQGGMQAGLRATPTFFLNGVLVDVSYGLQRLHDAVRDAS